jgi:hypothetical protein
VSIPAFSWVPWVLVVTGTNNYMAVVYAEFPTEGACKVGNALYVDSVRHRNVLTQCLPEPEARERWPGLFDKSNAHSGEGRAHVLIGFVAAGGGAPASPQEGNPPQGDSAPGRGE